MKKRNFLITMIMLMTCLMANAQHFKDSKYYNEDTKRLDYSDKRGQQTWSNRYRFHLDPYNYYGIRIGANMSTVQSDDPWLDGGRTLAGLNISAIAGFSLSSYTPLYLETGISYSEKGGRRGSGRDKVTYALNYLEVPVVAKYIYSPDSHLTVQPYAGGYLALGITGKTKNFENREAYNSFGSDKPGMPRFQRFDGGLKVGCGIGYDVLYADISYSYGLSNISHDSFDSSHNSTFSINVGVNF